MDLPFIMVAPTGARRTKVDHPRLPMHMDELVQTTISCHRAGADALHLHVRDKDGQHSLDVGQYRETIAEITKALPDFPIQITTESAGVFDVPAQLALLSALKPQWASISVREIDRSPNLADAIYGTCSHNGTKVQHILYGPDDLELLAQLQVAGVVRPDQVDVICVLGRYSKDQTSYPGDLQPFLKAQLVPPNWMVCGFGPFEHLCLLDAARAGGTLRVGFENSLTGENGTPHADNAASVAALCQRLREAA